MSKWFVFDVSSWHQPFRQNCFVNVFVLVEDGVNSDFLFEESLGKVDLGGSISSVDLDFHNVCLLQSKVELLDLGVGDDTNDGAELLDAFEFGIDALSTIFGVLGGVFGKGLLLGTVPVLVRFCFSLHYH